MNTDERDEGIERFKEDTQQVRQTSSLFRGKTKMLLALIVAAVAGGAKGEVPVVLRGSDSGRVRSFEVDHSQLESIL